MAVDTGTSADKNGVRHNVTKLFPLAHINAVIAGRGDMLFLSRLFLTGHLSLLGDVAVADECMLDFVRFAYNDAERSWTQIYNLPLALPEAQSAVLVGWSQRERRIIATKYEQKKKEHGFVSEEITQADPEIGPWDPRFQHLVEKVRTRNDIEPLARAQVELIRELEPSAGGGGSLLVARVDERGITIQRQCEL